MTPRGFEFEVIVAKESCDAKDGKDKLEQRTANLLSGLAAKLISGSSLSYLASDLDTGTQRSPLSYNLTCSTVEP
jgi:hypothetical protein